MCGGNRKSKAELGSWKLSVCLSASLLLLLPSSTAPPQRFWLWMGGFYCFVPVWVLPAAGFIGLLEATVPTLGSNQDKRSMLKASPGSGCFQRGSGALRPSCPMPSCQCGDLGLMSPGLPDERGATLKNKIVLETLSLTRFMAIDCG